MALHMNKKLGAGLLALSAAFVMGACDAIEASPTNYNDPIVVNVGEEGGVDLYDNIMGKIYDAITSNKNDKVVNKLLEDLATSKFGTYAEVMEAKADATKKAAYISNHAKKEGDVFFVTDEDKKCGLSVADIQDSRFQNLVDDFEKRISEAFYNEITSESYKDKDGMFDEEKLYKAHFAELYDFVDGIFKSGKSTYAKFFVTGEIDKETAYNELNVDYSNPDTAKRGYIEKKVFPQILKDKLVEEYIFRNNYSSLGRAYAREVNLVKVPVANTTITRNILKQFADTFIEQIGATKGVVDFDILTNTFVGFKGINGSNLSEPFVVVNPQNGAAETLIADNMDEKIIVPSSDDYKYNGQVLVPAGTYYKDTKLGKLLESYEKAIRAEKAGRFADEDDVTELNTFATEGKPKEIGLKNKIIELAKTDYTTDGWYVKNGGLSELPSKVRDRLFNINVANALDDESKLWNEVPGTNMGDYEYVKKADPDNEGDYIKDGLVKRLPYMRSIAGNKFIIPADAETFQANRYSYIIDGGDSAYYIVQVLEAPSTGKLNLDSKASYKETNASDLYKTEKVARQVAKILSTKDTYIKNAYTKYLEEYVFTFSDSSLYDYFKSQYPDLFEDEE